MKKIPLMISGIIVAIILSVIVGASADDQQYPFETDGVTYSDLNDAFENSVSGVVHAILDGSQNSQVIIPNGKTLIIDNGVTVYFNTSASQTLRVQGNLTLYGNIVTNKLIGVNGGSVLNLYGDISAPHGTALLVNGSATVYFNGSIISASTQCVRVNELGTGANLIVNGGSFYSKNSNNPIEPLDAITFDDNVTVSISNGIIVAISNDTVLGSVTRMVNASTDWIRIFISAVVSQALLTLISTVAFVGLGIGLIKRIKK